MGLLAGASEEPKQLEAGAGEEEGSAQVADAGDAQVQDAHVEAVEDGPGDEESGDEVIAEAELLERFKDLEKNAEA